MPDINTPNQAEGTTQPQEIIIDVQNSLYAKHFSKTQLIHGDEFNTLKNAIKSRISNLENNSGNSTDNDTEERRSEAYTVLGTRGSGKSSFLYSLIHWCKNEEEKNKIQVLDLIDPTLFENKGHILLTIIAQLRHLVDKVHNDRILRERECECDYKEWHKKFESLARGIPSIKDEGFIKDNWSEPGFVMNQGVQDVYSAYTMEKNFNDFVKCSLKFLEKKLLVIIFDDIDIDFRKGWEVLETVRKYLTSKQVFVIISGDAKLFSKSIRKVQWKNFGKALLKNEADKGQKEDYNNLVTEMESQYMQKVMPTQYRIYLRSLLDIVGNVSNSVMVGAENIRTYYNKNLFQGYEATNPVQAKVFTDFLLSLPLRTQMQLMTAFGDMDNQPRNLVMPFVSHLLDNGINYEDLLRFPNKLNAIILKFLVSNKIVEESYQLQPNILDTDINACLVALSLVSSRHYKNNAYLIFDYLVRVGFLRFVKCSILEYADICADCTSAYIIDYFVKHAQLYNDIDLKVSVGNAIAYLDGLEYEGITKIYGLGKTAKEGNMDDRIDIVFGRVGPIERVLGFLPLTISKYTNKQSSELNYSVVALLAAITDIVREASRKPKIENYLDENEKIIKEKVTKSERGQTIIEFLNYLSQVRNYIIPTDNDVVSDMAESDEIEWFLIDENDDGVAEFILALSNWIDEYSGIVVPPYLLGKIATRTFASIDSLGVSKDANLGVAIHRRLIILLNAILVEEAREYGYDLNKNNPSGSDNVFIYNFLKLKKDSSDATSSPELKLFNWIKKCPLILAYMNMQMPITPSQMPINIYAYLSHVAVKGGAPVVSDEPPIPIPPKNNKINFSAYNPACLDIIKTRFSTPNDLFADLNDNQVRIKLKKYFHIVKLESVERFRKMYGNKEAW